jgi:hypothetical protein
MGIRHKDRPIEGSNSPGIDSRRQESMLANFLDMTAKFHSNWVCKSALTDEERANKIVSSSETATNG